MIATPLRLAHVGKTDATRRECPVLTYSERLRRQPKLCQRLPKSISWVRVVHAFFRRPVPRRRTDKDHVEPFPKGIGKDFVRHLLSYRSEEAVAFI